MNPDLPLLLETKKENGCKRMKEGVTPQEVRWDNIPNNILPFSEMYILYLKTRVTSQILCLPCCSWLLAALVCSVLPSSFRLSNTASFDCSSI